MRRVTEGGGGEGSAEGAPLPAWLRALGRALDVAARACLAFAMLVLALVLVLMNLEIGGRYLLGVSTLVADEYGGYGFALVVLAGLLHAHRQDALLRVEFGVRRLRGRPRRAVLAAGSLLGAGLALVSAYAGYRTWALSWLFGSTSAFASETPLWIPQAALPLGFALLALSFLEEALRRIYGAER